MILRKKEGVGAKPPPKKGAEGQSPPSLDCFCAYIAGLPTKNPQFPTGPLSLLGGWKGLSHLFNFEWLTFLLRIVSPT